jgi:uncharacterized repeat protein (TIGR01451 family)
VTDAPDPATAGQPITYTLMIRNNGPRSARGVKLTDDLPAGVTRGAVTTTQGSCGGTDPVGCNLGGIASGAQATVTVTITPMAAGTITNQASVEANKTDPNAGNNSVSTETTVVDVISTTPLGLENPQPAGCELVNGEIACPETASSSSISFDVMVGLQGNDTIKGLDGNDLICGGSGNDRLFGGRGRDRLDGGRGNDTLDGGRGEDTCKGGGEADTARRCEQKRGVP